MLHAERTRGITPVPARRRRRWSGVTALAVALGSAAVSATTASEAAARTDTPAAVSPVDHGAVANDGIDDLAAFQAAVAQAKRRGADVEVPAGTFSLSGVLVLDGVVLRGQGRDRTTLVSTDPDAASIGLTGTGPALGGVTHAIPHAASRAATLGVQSVVVKDAVDFRVIATRLVGARGSGILVRNSTRGVIRGNAVMDTLADGIHVTDGSSSLTIANNTVTRSGDDGIAVVSYQRDASVSQDVLITGNTVTDGRSRGLAVVGGESIALTENVVTRSANAGVYIAAEGEWATRSVSSVHVARNRVTDSPSSSRSGHSSILVYASTGSVSEVWFQANEVSGSPTTSFGSWVRRTLTIPAGSIGRLLYTRNVALGTSSGATRFLDGVLEFHGNQGF